MSAASVSPLLLDVSTDNHEIIQALWDANATRYLSAAGTVILIFDHALTFMDEVKLVWGAPRSFAKHAFLVNRYIVLGCMLAVAYEMCGFLGDALTNTGCKRLLFTTSTLSLISIGMANYLVLMRVVILWDHRPIINKLMTGGFLISFAAQIAMMLWTLVVMEPGLIWVSEAGMCVTTITTPILIAVWASPMLFEVCVLFFTLVNALDRPRQAEMPLTKALQRDGIAYFLSVTSFRVLNLTLSIAARSSLTLLGVFFVWGIVATIQSRSLLHLRKVELKSRTENIVRPRAISPFGIGDTTDSEDEFVKGGPSNIFMLANLRTV